MPAQDKTNLSLSFVPTIIRPTTVKATVYSQTIDSFTKQPAKQVSIIGKTKSDAMYLVKAKGRMGLNPYVKISWFDHEEKGFVITLTKMDSPKPLPQRVALP